MNGFKQINAFYSFVFSNTSKINATHVSLYVFLWNQNNRNNWVEWFKCPFDLAMQGACIGNRNTYYKCLNDLKNWNLIDYQPGINGYKAPTIKLIQLYDSDTTTDTATDTSSDTSSDTTTDTTTVHNIKHITNKQKTRNSIYPTLQEVEEYFDLHGYSKESACMAFQYYASANWKDRNGKQVKAWKQKMHGVWFKPENKKTAEPKKYISYIPENENKW